MDSRDYDMLPSRSGRKRGRQRKNAAKRIGAKDLLRRAAWLSQPLVYWSGEPAPTPCADDLAYRPIPALLVERLSGQPAGLYTVELQRPELTPAMLADPDTARPRVNPTASGLVRVTGRRVATTAFALGASLRYPKALPKLVGDADAWRARVERALQHARAALHAVEALASGEPEALALEQSAAWVGDGATRPSLRLDTDALVAWLESCPDGPGRRCAAVALGQRHAPCTVQADLRTWMSCGAALSRWPADLVCCLPDRKTLASRLPQAVSACPGLNSDAAALAALEYRLAAPDGDLMALIRALPPLLAAFEAARDEPARRRGQLLSLLQRAFDAAPAYIAAERAPHRPPPRARWRWNDAADGEIARRLEQFRRAAGYPEGAPRTGDSHALAHASDWVLGYDLVELHIARGRRQPEADTAEAMQTGLLDRVAGAIARLSLPLAAGWLHSLTGLTGRLAAVGDPRRTAASLAAWLDTCRTLYPPGLGGDGALKLALASLENGLALSDWSASAVAALVGAVGAHGEQLLVAGSRAALWDHCLPAFSALASGLFGTLMALCHLGTLPADQRERIIRHDAFAPILAVLGRRPASLDALTAWMAEVDEDWLSLDASDQEGWAWLFCVGSPRLARLLTGRAARAVRDWGFSWAAAAALGQAGLSFCGSRWHGDPVDPQREDFLHRCPWLLDKLARAAREQAEGLPKGSHEDWGGAAGAVHRRTILLDVVYRWHQEGHGRLRELADRLLELGAGLDRDRLAQGKKTPPAQYVSSEADDLQLVVALAGGDPQRLLGLLAYRPTGWRYRDHPLKGWRFLDGHPRVQSFLRSCAGATELIPRIVRLLGRLALAVRLESHRPLRLALVRWEDPQPPAGATLPEGVPPPLASRLERLSAYRALAGKPPSRPSAIDQVLRRPEALRAERQALEERERTGRLPEAAAPRLANLRDLLAHPDHLHDWIERDLAHAVDRQMQLAQLAALEAVAQDVIRRHWDAIFGEASVALDDPDWDNALALWSQTTENKRLLKQLLRHLAAGDRHWAREHPVNVAFLDAARAAGLDAEAWLGRHERHEEVRGETWTAYAESDPLRVLQMGNLFGTCLSVGDLNAFATVANAVEVNKRVLYIRDGQGRVVGRKLVALSREGVLFGFCSYGAAGSEGHLGWEPWVKILLDVLCLDLARRCGARLPSKEEEEGLDKDDGASLRLFAQWYLDGAEPFDWWTTLLARVDSGEPMKPSVFGRLVADTLRYRGSKSAREGHDFEATLRALIWLGDEALPLLPKMLRAAWLSPLEARFVRKHTRSDALRAGLRTLAERAVSGAGARRGDPGSPQG